MADLDSTFWLQFYGTEQQAESIQFVESRQDLSTIDFVLILMTQPDIEGMGWKIGNQIIDLCSTFWLQFFKTNSHSKKMIFMGVGQDLSMSKFDSFFDSQ